MKTSIKKLKDCKVKMTIEVEAKLVEQRFGEILKEFQKKAQFPGFREGKAPIEMVEKRYTKEAEEETIKSLIPELYHQAVSEQKEKEKVVPVSLPKIGEINFVRGKNLSFSADFEREPDLNVKNYKGIKLKKVDAAVEVHEVEKGVKSLLESRSEVIPVIESRAVRQGDLIVSDIEMWQDGQFKPGRKGVLLQAEPNAEDDFFEKVVGAQINDVREILVEPTAAEKEKGVVGRKPLYKVHVREIRERKLPALDESFAKIFGKETVEELHEAVRKDIAQYKKTESMEKMKVELFEKLIAAYSFDLPSELVDKQKERLVDQSRKQAERMGVTPQKFQEELSKIEEEAAKKAKEQVKLYFILQKISEAESIEADEIVLAQRLEAIALESKRPIDEARRVFEEDLRESLRETQTIEFLLANANLQDEPSTKS